MDFGSFFDYPTEDSTEESSDYVLMHEWGNAEWSRLLNHTQTQIYDPGDVVIRAGDAERALYIVAFGTLEVLIKQRGQHVRLALVQTGSVIGEQSFLDGRPRSANIRAVTACQILQLTVDSFEVFAAREPALARMFLFDLGRILSLRLRHTVSQFSLWK
jgi:CRP-like cAMP-binding protein